MKDINHQKLTGEWHKHLRKRLGLMKIANKRRRVLLTKIQNDESNESV